MGSSSSTTTTTNNNNNKNNNNNNSNNNHNDNDNNNDNYNNGNKNNGHTHTHIYILSLSLTIFASTDTVLDIQIRCCMMLYVVVWICTDDLFCNQKPCLVTSENSHLRGYFMGPPSWFPKVPPKPLVHRGSWRCSRPGAATFGRAGGRRT